MTRVERSQVGMTRLRGLQLRRTNLNRTRSQVCHVIWQSLRLYGLVINGGDERLRAARCIDEAWGT
jgi:hypothetical protein